MYRGERENGDEHNARVADTAWIQSRKAGYAAGMQLRWQNGQWSIYSMADTTTAVPSAMPVPRTPVPSDLRM